MILFFNLRDLQMTENQEFFDGTIVPQFFVCFHKKRYQNIAQLFLNKV